MDYQVKVENFEGPMDLLLFFIQRDKLNIYDIPIAHIVKEFLDYMKMMDLMNIEEEEQSVKMDSIGSKIWHIVDKFFPMGKFTSTNILEKYEDEFNEPVKLSVISTYLSRFTSKGRVERIRTGREWTYQSIKITQKQQ